MSVRWGRVASSTVVIAATTLLVARGALPELALERHESADPATAARLWRLLCAMRMPEACARLGLQLGRGDGVTRDVARAAELLAAGCEAGFWQACTELGGLQADSQRALALYTQGCVGGGEVGDPAACARAGLIADELGSPGDSVALLDRGCDAGSAEGCMRLARAYRAGYGVAREDDHAARLSARGCRLGSVAACVDRDADVLRHEFHSTDTAHERTEAWCDAGSAAGCTRLGFDLRDGTGGPSDPSRVAAVWLQACDGRDNRGCAALGEIVAATDAGDPLRHEAVALLERQCDAGIGGGCVGLGDALRSFDRARAMHLLATGCENGEPFGCARIFDEGLDGGEGQRVRARATIDALILRDPWDGDLLRWRAAALLDEGADAQALDDLDRLIELAADDADGLNLRAWVKVRLGDFAGARSDAEKAVAGVRDAASLGTLCFALAGLGQRRPALAACREALELEHDEPLNRGMVAWLEGRKAEAWREWKKADAANQRAVSHFRKQR